MRWPVAGGRERGQASAQLGCQMDTGAVQEFRTFFVLSCIHGHSFLGRCNNGLREASLKGDIHSSTLSRTQPVSHQCAWTRLVNWPNLLRSHEFKRNQSETKGSEYQRSRDPRTSCTGPSSICCGEQS